MKIKITKYYTEESRESQDGSGLIETYREYLDTMIEFEGIEGLKNNHKYIEGHDIAGLNIVVTEVDHDKLLTEA